MKVVMVVVRVEYVIETGHYETHPSMVVTWEIFTVEQNWENVPN